MVHPDAKPKFGGKLKQPSYYSEIRAYIDALRDTKTQRQIALMLNTTGSRTPTGKPWDRQAIANFIRNTAV